VAKAKIDISKHILIPKHTKLSEKDKKELFDKYNLTVKELPKILLTDPAIANLDLKPSDVVKITRKSPTSNETIFYRRVSNA